MGGEIGKKSPLESILTSRVNSVDLSKQSPRIWQLLLCGTDQSTELEYPLPYMVSSSSLCVPFLRHVGCLLMKNSQGLHLMPMWNKGQRIPHAREFMFSIQLTQSKGQEVSSLAAPQHLPPRTHSC